MAERDPIRIHYVDPIQNDNQPARHDIITFFTTTDRPLGNDRVVDDQGDGDEDFALLKEKEKKIVHLFIFSLYL